MDFTRRKCGKDEIRRETNISIIFPFIWILRSDGRGLIQLLVMRREIKYNYGASVRYQKIPNTMMEIQIQIQSLIMVPLSIG